jgi:hypothetical protein
MDENLFCTLAIGPQYRDLAAFLCADLAIYKQDLLIVTDDIRQFAGFHNAIVHEYRPKVFSYHDKKIALRLALQQARTAVFVDADTCIHFPADRRAVKSALRYSFSPGLHAMRLFPEGVWEYPGVESFAVAHGLQFQRNVITYWEGLFAVSRHENVDRFFELWDLFHAEADRTGHNGSGEGTCIGIAAEAAPIPRWYTNQMLESGLPHVFWPTRMTFRRRRLHHLKFIATEAIKGNLNFHMHAWALR